MDNSQKEYGWIKLYRKLSLNEMWLSEPFTRGQAWVDLMMLANHKDGFIRVRGIKIPILRGQVGWSELKLSGRWKWSRSKVRRFIFELQNEQQIEQQIILKNSVLTILNYDYYQGEEQQKEQQNERQTNNKKTTEEQQKDTNKNDKNEENDKKEKNSVPSSDETPPYFENEPRSQKPIKLTFEEDHLKIANRLKGWVLKNKPDANVPEKLDSWANTVRLMIQSDKRSITKIVQIMDWCQRDEFWRINIRSMSKFREQFDRLEMEMNRKSGLGKSKSEPAEDKSRERFKRLEELG